MKIAYLFHSGFSVEFEDKVLVFDYWKGALPKTDSAKKWYVFASHGHGDHYNREVLSLREQGLDVTYIFAKDILTQKKARENDIVRMKAKEECVLGDVRVRTLRSNDEGVAYLVKTNGKTLYHAGDLNWWHWEGEPESDNRFMEQSYREEIAKLQGETIDVGFVVLDPRQEKQFFWGFDWYMRHTDTRLAIPMHLWEDYALPGRLCAMEEAESYRERVRWPRKAGEVLYDGD